MFNEPWQNDRFNILGVETSIGATKLRLQVACNLQDKQKVVKPIQSLASTFSIQTYQHEYYHPGQVQYHISTCTPITHLSRVKPFNNNQSLISLPYQHRMTGGVEGWAQWGDDRQMCGWDCSNNVAWARVAHWTHSGEPVWQDLQLCRTGRDWPMVLCVCVHVTIG